MKGGQADELAVATACSLYAATATPGPLDGKVSPLLSTDVLAGTSTRTLLH
jgi:hypothetical protein